jgi:hypothetical protein
MRSFVTCSRPSHPAGCPTRFTGASSTVCMPACASGWRRWPPTRTTRPGISSRSGSPGSPTALRHPRSCASAGSASSAMFWPARGYGTGTRRCGRRPRTPCGPRRATRNLSCAAGWPMRWWPSASVSGQTSAFRRALSAWSSQEPGHSPFSSTTSSPASSRGPSSGGTPPRRRASWNCSSGPTCSTSASTARWWARAWGWPCTRSSWRWPYGPRRRQDGRATR